MKQNALLVISIGVFAFGESVFINKVSNEFSKSARTVHLERLESRVKYNDLIEQFSNLTENLLNKLISELYYQARVVSSLTINKVESTAEQLCYATINRTNHVANDTYADELLKKLNQNLDNFLKLRPGEELVSPELPHIPAHYTNLHSYLHYHSLEELFLGLATVVDTHLSNINVIYNTIFEKGWLSARTALGELQRQFRSEFVNDHQINAFGNVVSKVFNNSAIIRNQVLPKTWDKFADLGGRVKNIYGDIKSSSSTRSSLTENNFLKI